MGAMLGDEWKKPPMIANKTNTCLIRLPATS
jgi:hypothetical protein